MQRRARSRVLALVVVLAGSAACGRGHTERREPPLAAIVRQCGDKELGCPRPIFAVARLQESLAYYRDQLGFRIDWQYGEPADFASVTRGELTLFLGESPHGGGGALWASAREVDQLHAELVKRGAIVKLPPTDMPWGARELHVADRDGNVLRFAGHAPEGGKAR